MTKKLDSGCPGCGMRSMTSVEWTARARRIAELEAQVKKLKEDIRIMVEKAADNKLDGYRELGERAAQAENERDDSNRDVVKLKAKIGQLTSWTHFYGATLCPSGADTYGEGMRNAKQQVSKILTEGE